MLRNMKFGYLHITLAIVYLITEAMTLYTKYSQEQPSQKNCSMEVIWTSWTPFSVKKLMQLMVTGRGKFTLLWRHNCYYDHHSLMSSPIPMYVWASLSFIMRLLLTTKKRTWSWKGDRIEIPRGCEVVVDGS